MSPPSPSSARRAWVLASLWGLAAYLFHSIGNANGLYVEYWWFQIIAHVWSATGVAALLLVFGCTVGLRGERLLALVVLGTAVGALGWEVVEYLGVFENLHFWGLEDMLLDLTADTVGLAAVLELYRRRYGSGEDAAATPLGNPELAD